MLIYQLTNTTPYQMMGYVIKTNNNKVIVIDGGNHGQSDELYRVLCEAGKEVELWFLTHIHDDHYGAIIDLFNLHGDINVKRFIRNNCSPEVCNSLDGADKDNNNEWLEYEKKSSLPFEAVKKGDIFEIDNVKIECLSENNPDILVNNQNNQSIVLKFTEKDFSIIFLADLGAEGGRKLLKTAGDKLKAEAVQMAHHGQAGVEKEVYEKIGAKYAFWPTPKWLWDNTPYLGGEPGKGAFQTPEVINWMRELKCKNITSFTETTLFDTEKV